MVNRFFTLDHDGTTYEFRRPTTAELDRNTARLAKAPVSASIEFTSQLVIDSQRDTWRKAVTDMPGLAVRAQNEMLDQLGFSA